MGGKWKFVPVVLALAFSLSGCFAVVYQPPPPPVPPDGSNTGVPAGATLTPSASITTSFDGQVIENREVTGMISVQHRNVVIRNVRVYGTQRYGVEVPYVLRDTGAAFTLEDSEIIGISGERSAGIAPYGPWTVQRVRIRGFQDAVKVGSNQNLLSSWLINDYALTDGGHYDAVQSTGGKNVVIRGNRIEGPWKSQTSAVIFSTDFAAISNYTIENNYLSGGNYTAYSRNNHYGAPTNMVFKNNVFERNSWQFGVLSVNKGSGWRWENNRYDDGTLIAA